MPTILVFLSGMLATVLKYVAGRVVFMLGIQAVTIVGVLSALEEIQAAFIATYQGLPASMLQVLGLLRVDQAALVIFSAVLARYTLGVAGGNFTRIVAGQAPTGQL